MTMQTFPNGYPDEPESSKQTGTEAWHTKATIKEALREFVGDGDGADESVLVAHDREVEAQAKLSLLRELLSVGLYSVRYTINDYPIQAVPKSVLLEYRNVISREIRVRCNCGYGGFHEENNPLCDRNKGGLVPSEDPLSPAAEAETIMDMLNLDGWDCEEVTPGVLKFTDYTAGRSKTFLITITEMEES